MGISNVAIKKLLILLIPLSHLIFPTSLASSATIRWIDAAKNLAVTFDFPLTLTPLSSSSAKPFSFTF